MANPPDPIQRTLDLLYAALPEVMEDAMNIALHQSLQTAALVKELESKGYRVTAQLDYTLTATPVEAIFNQSLNEDDLRFLEQVNRFETQ